MLTRIHVNQHIIKANRVTGNRNPVLTVKTSRENRYAHAVEIAGPARVVYLPDKPLSCGATVWIETESEVHIVNGADAPDMGEPELTETERFLCPTPTN